MIHIVGIDYHHSFPSGTEIDVYTDILFESMNDTHIFNTEHGGITLSPC